MSENDKRMLIITGEMMIDFVELIKDLFVAATLAYATLGIAWLICYVLVKHFGFKRKGKQNDFL